MENARPLPDRGKTWFDGATPPSTYESTVDIEGVTKCFDDIDSTTGIASSQQRRSGRQVRCRFVRNVATITLESKRAVRWAAGQRKKRIDGYCRLDHAEAAGVVDEFYSTGIRQHDLGWIIVGGPGLVKTSLGGDATNVISEGDTITALTAATSQATTAGRIQAYNVTSNATLGGQAVLNKIGRAMSAKTTANTNADLLVDFELFD